MLLSAERPFVGAFAFHIPGATLLHLSGLVRQSCRRRLNMCEWTIEILQELARSCRFLSRIPGWRHRANQLRALAGQRQSHRRGLREVAQGNEEEGLLQGHQERPGDVLLAPQRRVRPEHQFQSRSGVGGCQGGCGDGQHQVRDSRHRVGWPHLARPEGRIRCRCGGCLVWSAAGTPRKGGAYAVFHSRFYGGIE